MYVHFYIVLQAERCLSVVGVYMEGQWSVIEVTSGQPRNNLGARSGQPLGSFGQKQHVLLVFYLQN